MRKRTSVIAMLLLCGGLCSGLFGCADATDGSSCASSFGTVPSTAANVSFLASTTEVAQSFQVTADTSAANIYLNLQAVTATPSSSLTGTVILKLEGNSTASGSNAPDGVPLTTVTLTASQIVTSGSAYYAFAFSSPTVVNLYKSLTYWVRLKYPYASATNYIQWIGNNDAAYSSGEAKSSSDGTNWDNGILGTGRDFLFRVGC